MKRIKSGLQSRLVSTLTRLSHEGKWRELSSALKQLNPFVTRHSIGAYWKVLDTHDSDTHTLTTTTTTTTHQL